MAVTGFAGQLDEQLIVYDCMDELSLFRAAPRELVRRERELLAVADVVFARGLKIWRLRIALAQPLLLIRRFFPTRTIQRSAEACCSLRFAQSDVGECQLHAMKIIIPDGTS